MALRMRNKKWVWDFYPDGRSGQRLRITLPDVIKTEDEANRYIQTQGHKLKELHDVGMYKPDRMNALIGKTLDALSEDNPTHRKALERVIKALIAFSEHAEISREELTLMDDRMIEDYKVWRLKSRSAVTVNRELFRISEIYDYWLRIGCASAQFEMPQHYVNWKSSPQAMLSEHFFNRLAMKHPDLFFNEKLTKADIPCRLGNLLPDGLLIDKEGNCVIVETQKLNLDRQHAYKILEYKDKLENSMVSKNITFSRIRMFIMVIGDGCSDERSMFLAKHGIELKIIPVKIVEKILFDLLKL